MQPWPLWPFRRVKEVLLNAGCECELAFAAGAATGLDGKPTPAVYGITRVVRGEKEMAPLVAYDDDDLISYDDLRTVCDSLELDLAMFGPIN